MRYARRRAFSPAYDLLSTEPYEKNQWSMTLAMRGKKVDLPRRMWLDFAEADCKLDRPHAEQVIDAMLAKTGEAEALIARSPLDNPEWKRNYVRLLEKRARQLTGRA